MGMERITGPRPVSAFREKAALSVSEFFEAGDNLDAKCRTRSWQNRQESGDQTNQRKPNEGKADEDQNSPSMESVEIRNKDSAKPVSSTMGGGGEDGTPKDAAVSDIRDILIYVAPDMVTPMRIPGEQRELIRREFDGHKTKSDDQVSEGKNILFQFTSTRGYRNELIPPPALPESDLEFYECVIQDCVFSRH